MSNKLIDNKRRSHAEKILEKNSEKASPKVAQVKSSKRGSALSSSDEALREQYKVIRQDLIKLRDDLAKGLSLAKTWMGNKSEAIRSR
mgnify:CR=1 FL=1